MQHGVREIVDVQELPARAAGPPQRHRLATELRVVELADHGRQHVGTLQVEVVARAVEVGRHGGDEVRAVLLAIGLAELDAGDLGDRIGLVGRLQQAGQQALLDDRLFGEFAKQGSGIGHGAGQIGSGSLLSGFHVDNSAFVNAGEVVPGDAAGAGYFAVQGDFTQVSAGSLWIELGGDVAGQQFDQLFVTGNASLAGSLAVSLLDEYVPQVGDFFVVAAYGSHEGKFSQMSLPPLTEADAFWDVQYGDHSVTLSVHTRRADFNDDEHIDARDIDILTDQFGSADLSFDLNGDNVVDQLDVDHLVHDILSTEYGDADLDLDVDEVDLSIWQSNTFRDLSGWSNADFNGDGLADVSDFNLWFANRGFTLVEGPEAVPAQAVPEPGGYSWIPGLCWVAFLYRRAARTDIYAE